MVPTSIVSPSSNPDSNLDPVFHTALGTFWAVVNDGELRREREVLNLFVFGHLLPLVSPNGPLHSGGQLAIEAAVPQHKAAANLRKEPDVCKDLVIWPRPWMTCWNSEGLPRRFPIAIAEWKVVSWRDNGTTARKKITEYHRNDIPFLKRMSAEQGGFIGYAILLDLREHHQFLRCARVEGGEVVPSWLSWPDADAGAPAHPLSLSHPSPLLSPLGNGHEVGLPAVYDRHEKEVISAEMRSAETITVKKAGARAGDVLVGVKPRNARLVVKVKANQDRGHGGRIEGPFELLDSGTGPYARGIESLRQSQQAFQSVEDFIRKLKRFPGCEAAEHILLANGLARSES
ncbi:MAG: hypothetical protein ACRD6N_19950 [Pyrinomonadaceae bacterium]